MRNNVSFPTIPFSFWRTDRKENVILFVDWKTLLSMSILSETTQKEFEYVKLNDLGQIWLVQKNSGVLLESIKVFKKSYKTKSY